MAIDIGFSVYTKWIHEEVTTGNNEKKTTIHRLVMDITFDREPKLKIYERFRKKESAKVTNNLVNDGLIILRRPDDQHNPDTPKDAIVNATILYEVDTANRSYTPKTVAVKYAKDAEAQSELRSQATEYLTSDIREKEVRLDIWEYKIHEHYQTLLSLKKEQNNTSIIAKLASIIKSYFGNSMSLSDFENTASAMEELEKLTHQRGHTTVIIGSGD